MACSAGLRGEGQAGRGVASPALHSIQCLVAQPPRQVAMALSHFQAQSVLPVPKHKRPNAAYHPLSSSLRTLGACKPSSPGAHGPVGLVAGEMPPGNDQVNRALSLSLRRRCWRRSAPCASAKLTRRASISTSDTVRI